MLGHAAANAAIWSGAATISANEARPIYTGIAEWTSQATMAKAFAKKIGLVGITVSLVDMRINGRNTSNTLDLVFGFGSTFGGTPGAIAGGIYFTTDLITEGATGKDIGQHIDNNFYIISSYQPGVSFMLIPKN